jgi:hypothetical protein
MSLPLAFPFLLNQTATYWAPGGPDGFGQVLFSAAPVLIKCRWQNVQKLFVGFDKEEHQSNAVVYPDRELAEKGMIALGDHTGEPDPRNLPGVAWEVRGDNWSPSVAGDSQMNKVFL